MAREWVKMNWKHERETGRTTRVHTKYTRVILTSRTGSHLEDVILKWISIYRRIYSGLRIVSSTVYHSWAGSEPAERCLSSLLPVIPLRSHILWGLIRSVERNGFSRRPTVSIIRSFPVFS